MRAASLLLLLAACNPYDDDLGPTPFLCGAAEPRCPRGYTCVQDPDDGREVCSDSAPAEFNCADDSTREPNELTTEPTATTIDAMATFALEGAAICPDGDRDVYSLELTADASVELLVTFQGDGAVLEAAILNAGGVPIAGAAPLEEDATTIRALASFLTAGPYFVQVNAPDASIRRVNNYSIEINVVP
jgi:hypothetical protein